MLHHPVVETRSRYTCKEVVEWILEHRGTRSFRGWTAEQITAQIFDCLKFNGFLYVADESGILGIIISYPRPDFKVLCIDQFIATNRKAIQMFVEEFYRRFDSSWSIAFERDTKTWRICPAKQTAKLLRKIYHVN